MEFKKWVWQQDDWPKFHWNDVIVQRRLRDVRLKQGILLGMAGADVEEHELNSTLDNLVGNIVSSSAIEGELLNVESVRSSLAKRMGIRLNSTYPSSTRSEGVAKIMMDVISNLQEQLTLDRLYQWHRWLFPDNEDSFFQVRVGCLRGEETMQVVSGRIDKPKVHFEAPPRALLEEEVRAFITWFNQSHDDAIIDPLLRAGICHFWFVTLHPFDDGNGRITRALTDLALAQAEHKSIMLYAMSPVILSKRRAYYDVLEQSQRGDLDLSNWLIWFLDALDESLQKAIDKINVTLQATKFWNTHQGLVLSKEQIKVLNRLLNGGEKGFEQGISASQYQKVAKVSKATATRHLAFLLEHSCLEKLPGGGRNTRYKIKRV